MKCTYFHELNQISTLTKEEEQELFIQFKNGDLEAKKTLIEHNLKLVIPIAKYYHSDGFTLYDLIQEGNIGLIHAIECFDITKDYKFSTYATKSIHTHIIHAIYKKGRILKIPRYVREQIKELRDSIEQLKQSLERTPTLKEISQNLNLPYETIFKLFYYMQDTVSLQTPIESKDGVRELEQLLCDSEYELEEQVLQSGMHGKLNSILNKTNILNEEERMILKYRFGFFGESLSLKRIGEQLNCTHEAVRKKEVRALKKLRLSNEILSLIAYTENPEQAYLQLEEYRNAYKTGKKIQEVYKIKTYDNRKRQKTM